MEFLESINQVKSNWQPYKKWEAEQDDAEFQRQELKKRVPKSKEELEQAAQYGRTLIESINIMDQYATDKAQDVEMASQLALVTALYTLMGAGWGIGLFIEKIPKVKDYLGKLPKEGMEKQLLLPLIKTMALPFLGVPFLVAKFATYEKEAARTARYQAREKKLKDPQNFVIYNEEQITKAKEIAKTLTNPVDKKKSSLNIFANYSDSAKSIKTILQDHKNYLKWKEEYLKAESNKKSSIANLVFTNQELDEAKNNQSNLLRTIRKIEVNSQNYQSNVEMALNIVLGFDLVFGAAIGIIASGIVHILQKAKAISPDSKYAVLIKGSAPILTPILLTVLTTSYATKIQKDAARVGRFKAKQELLNDPYNFINYSDEQLNSAKNIKAPKEPEKTLFEKIKKDFIFFFQLKKDYDEYKKYQKTSYKEEQKLNEALKQINTTDEQMKEAKSLQKNAFTTFEKIDEMSQRYVADVEAATDMAKNSAVMGTDFLSQIAMYCLAAKSASTKDLSKMIQSLYPMLMPLIVKAPIEIEATKIEKQAGKIGIMKAMQELEDPRLFIQKD